MSENFIVNLNFRKKSCNEVNLQIILFVPHTSCFGNITESNNEF